MELRFVIPRFDGEQAFHVAMIDAALQRFGATQIRINKRYGVTTFRMTGCDSAQWHSFLAALCHIHRNCKAWSYTQLTKETCDTRKAG